MKSIKIIFSAFVAGVIMLISNNAQATKWVVSVQNFSFSPSNLPGVIVGDTIRWVWVSGSHTTTSTTIPAGAASWDHLITISNTSYEYHVTIAGNYSYKCTPHVSMGMVGSFTATAPAPLLISIIPNHALQGESFLATITGSNTNFSGTPAVSLAFSNNPGETINATSVTVVSPTVLHAQFTIPVSASTGLWDVHVNALALPDAFTVIEVIPYLVSINPDSANQGEQVTTLITAADSRFTLSAPAVALSFTGNPSEIVDASSVNVLSDSQLEAVFNIPAVASPGSWDVHVDDMVLAGGFTVNLLSGIGETPETLVRTFPNPASQLFYIENAAGADVMVFSPEGKNILAQKIASEKQSVDITSLSPGIYIVRIRLDGNDRVEKLMVK